MTTHIAETFSECQLHAIISFQNKLQKVTSRNITLSEAIINWIALGYAEEYRNGYFFRDTKAN